MDRLSALEVSIARVGVVALAMLGIAGCDDKKPTGEASGRVNGAKVATRQGNTTRAFCDVYADAKSAAVFTWPALAGHTPPTSTGSTWRWVNVWATWCKPCIEEMPRIAKWRDKLATGTRALEVTFVSADASDAVVADFRKANPAVPESLRLSDPDKVNDWLQQLGLKGEPPIPVHVFLDPSNKIRCVRAAAIRDTDYAAVDKLLSE